MMGDTAVVYIQFFFLGGGGGERESPLPIGMETGGGGFY